MDRTDSTDVMLNRALRLAYFIHNDKPTALRIVASAMMRLETTAAAQDKRFYYTPIGRLLSDRLKSHGFRNKISLNTLDLLQLLVFIESEPYERRKEMGQGGVPAGEEDMIIHFIKHLVTITMKRNSFYVALGMCRLLHNYSTSETMDIYSVVLQDPDRTKDDHYCRSRKGRLMQEMKQRFGGLISAGRGPHGEERFHSLDRPARYAGLVRECLDLFSPWRTLCPVPAGFNPTRDLLSCLSSAGNPVDEDHQTEANRIHAIVHPDCFTRLTRALAFDCPEERLALPRFFTSNNGGNGHRPPSDRCRPPELESSDRAIIQRYLDEQAARRRAVAGRMFSIRVDGFEQANLSPDLSNTIRVEVDKGASMIEVVAFDECGEIVLATHLLDLERSRSGRASHYSITLAGGQEISFLAEPADDAEGEGRQRVIDISYREPASRRFASHQWLLSRESILANLNLNRRTLTALAVCVLLLAVAGSVLLQGRLTPRSPVQTSNSDVATAPDAAGNETSPRDTISGGAEERSAPDRPKNSGPPRRPAAIAKGIARRDSTGSISRPGTTSIRPSTETVSESEATREPEADASPASLLSVRRVFIECHGDRWVDQDLRGSFAGEIKESGRFELSDPEHADAALKVFETAGSLKRGQREGKRGIRVELVNRGGEILWRTARVHDGKSPRSARQTASEVLGELQHHIDELQKLKR